MRGGLPRRENQTGAILKRTSSEKATGKDVGAATESLWICAWGLHCWKSGTCGAGEDNKWSAYGGIAHIKGPVGERAPTKKSVQKLT